MLSMTLERELRRFGVEGLAVVKFHARPQLDGDGLAVGGASDASASCGTTLRFCVDVEQLVAKRSKDDAPDIGAGER